MKKYHYTITVNLETLEDNELAEHIFNQTSEIELYLNTNNKLDKNESLIVNCNNCLIRINIVKIDRLLFHCIEHELVEMDYSNP